jgi:hypothetical protein
MLGVCFLENYLVFGLCDHVRSSFGYGYL